MGATSTTTNNGSSSGKVHQRRALHSGNNSSSSSSSVNGSNIMESNPTSPSFIISNTRSSPSQPQRRKRSIPRNGTKTRILLRALPAVAVVVVAVLGVLFGLCGMASVFGWWWHAASDTISSSSSAGIPISIPVVDTTTTATFQMYSDQAPSCKALESPDEISFSLVSQLSHDRLWMMHHHCQRFGIDHPMSIAVYSNATLTQVQSELSDLGCSLEVVQVSVVDAQTVGSSSEYPVNLLRNVALSKVQTTHLIYIDVDFWTSQGLYDTLNHATIKQALWEDPKLALVIPAFMLFRQCVDYIDCRKNNIPIMPFTRDQVLKMMVGKKGHIFDPTNKGGHGSTLYKEWLHQEPSSLVNISCLISQRYEPFVVVRYCHDLPPFQPRFAGYGKNKMTWMMQVLRRGYTLRQVGGAFLVHYPHLDSKAREVWNESPETLKVLFKKEPNPQSDSEPAYRIRRPKASDGQLELATYKRGQVDQLFVEFRQWLVEEVPDTSRVPLCASAQDDDSKLWIDNTKEQQRQKKQTKPQQQEQQQSIKRDDVASEDEVSSGEEPSTDEPEEEQSDEEE